MNYGNYEFRIPKTGRIAQGTLKQVINIQQRALALTTIDDMEPAEGFTTLFTIMGRIITVQPSERFDGVNINGEQITHQALMNYDPVIFQLDKSKCFLTVEYNQMSGDINRVFKMIKIENLLDEGKFIIMSLKETGFANNVAVQG